MELVASAGVKHRIMKLREYKSGQIDSDFERLVNRDITGYMKAAFNQF